MPKYIAVVMTNCIDGQEEEFNRWYTDQHLDEILGLDAHVAVQRFELIDQDDDDPGRRFKYLTINEIAPGQLEAAMAANRAAIAEQTRAASEQRPGRFATATGLKAYKLRYYRAITERREANEVDGWPAIS